MKIFKKFIIAITVTMLLLGSIVPPKIVFASTPASSSYVGNAIASVAEDFFNRYEKKTIYDYSCSVRHLAYKNQRTSSPPYNKATGHSGWSTTYTDCYAIDCVGFVSMIVHCATGLGNYTRR